MDDLPDLWQSYGIAWNCNVSSQVSADVLSFQKGNLTYEQVATQTLSPEEKKIINDFVYLLEKSKQLFQQLRLELLKPYYGYYFVSSLLIITLYFL